MGRGKKKAANAEANGKVSNGTSNGPEKSVKFPPTVGKLNGGENDYMKPSGKGMKSSPSMATLNRMERDKIVLWRRPITTVHYFLGELLSVASDFAYRLRNYKLLVSLISVTIGALIFGYATPGSHQEYVQRTEKISLNYLTWLGLGVLSSIGFGSGLHTFLLYLAPFAAQVTMATYECGTLSLPLYPFEISCPEEDAVKQEPSVFQIWYRLLFLPTLCWGMGTALGELPPYFVARAARISGQEPDDEEYRQFLAEIQGDEKKNSEMSFYENLLTKGKHTMEQILEKTGFMGILVFASIPNPLFDLAGMICGHYLVPFHIFFGATLIGKAIVKAQMQILFVIFLFAADHVGLLVTNLALIPYIGKWIEEPLKEFFAKNKARLHHGQVDAPSVLGTVINYAVFVMVTWFVVSIVNSLAQCYHKRLCEAKKSKNK